MPKGERLARSVNFCLLLHLQKTKPNNMPTPTVNTIRQLTPTSIAASHFLAKATTKAAASFALGRETISVQLDPEVPRAASVTDFELPTAAANKLRRSDNVIEAVSSAIRTGSNTVTKLKKFLATVNVPVNIADNSQFYFMSVRRRDVPNATSADALNLSKRLPCASDQHFILGLSVDSKKNLIATIVLPSSKIRGKSTKGGASVVKFPRFFERRPGVPEAPPVETGPFVPAPEPPGEPAEAPDNTQDFADCYAKCMANIPGFLLTLAGAVCASCAATIAAAGAAGAIVLACAACAVAIGIILGNCLLTCHEML